MKNLPRFVSLTLALVLICTLLPKAAEPARAEVIGDSIIWTLDSETGILHISGSGEMLMSGYSYAWSENSSLIKEIVIDEGITSISEFAFSGCSELTAVSIPDSVTSIGACAFSGCGELTSLSIPDSVTSIGAYAFSNCRKLSSVQIPAGVEEIGTCPFQGCEALAALSVSPDSLYFSNDDAGALFDKDKTTLLEFPTSDTGSYSIPDGVVSIGQSAFDLCYGLTEVTIPNSVARIEAEAFSHTNLKRLTLPEGLADIGDRAFFSCVYLTDVTIPASVESIGKNVFEACWKLSAITVDPENRFYSSDSVGALYDKTKTTLLRFPQQYSGGCELPDSVTAIADYAFSDCWSLTSAALPDGVGQIGEFAFERCTSLTSIALPGGLREIEEYVFWGCTNLTSVGIPYGVTGIRRNAFFGCSSLQNVTIPTSVAVIEYLALGYSDYSTKVADFTIYGASGSAAEAYAIRYGFLFVPVLDCAIGSHDYSYSVTTAPTRSGAGLLTGTCTACGASETVSLPALDSAEYRYELLQAASCVTLGAARYTWKNTACGTISFDEILPLTGHSYQSIVFPPQCTEQGYTVVTCIHGDSQYVSDYTSPTGHTWNDGLILTAPTESESGRKSYTCLSCGASRLEILPPLGHVHSYALTVKAPTCTTAGYTIRTCPGCGDTFTDSYVAANGHSYSYTVETAPGVFSAGLLKGTCAADGAVVSVVLPNLNDTDYHRSLERPAACTAEGINRYTWKETSYGTICFDLPILPLGHDYEQGVCSRCGCLQADPDAALPFTDVKEGAYYYNAVRWAVNREIATGTSATTFSPKATCTRAQVVTFLWKAAGSPEPYLGYIFTDISPDKYYYKAVLWAVKHNIATGTSATTFGPKGTCTRAQIVTFLWNYCGCPEPVTTENPFTDIKPSSYYYKAVLWAYENDVTTGTSPTTFGPKNTCTRAQVVTFLWKALT